MPQNLFRQLKLEDKGFDPPYITDKIYTERLESVDLLLLLNKFEKYEYKGTGVIGDAFQFCLPIISLDQRFCMHSEEYIFHISEFKEIKYAKLLEWQRSRKHISKVSLGDIKKLNIKILSLGWGNIQKLRFFANFGNVAVVNELELDPKEI